jgi:AcrR family transcriptional regulator
MPPKTVLYPARVIAAAVDLLQREGQEALTLNRLAAELDVQPPSLYNHIAGMPGLLRELSIYNAQRLGDCLGQAAIGQAGPLGLMHVAEAYRGYIKANPALYMLSLRASGKLEMPVPALRAAEERVVHIVLAMLASLDLSGADAIHAARALRSAIHGFASLEVAGGFGIPLDLDESFQRLMLSLIAGFQRDHP